MLTFHWSFTSVLRWPSPCCYCWVPLNRITELNRKLFTPTHHRLQPALDPTVWRSWLDLMLLWWVLMSPGPRGVEEWGEPEYWYWVSRIKLNEALTSRCRLHFRMLSICLFVVCLFVVLIVCRLELSVVLSRLLSWVVLWKEKEGKPFGKPLTRSYDEVTDVTPKPVKVEAQGPPLGHRGWGARGDAEKYISGARDRPVHHQPCMIHTVGRQDVMPNRWCQNAGRCQRREYTVRISTLFWCELGNVLCREA